MTAETQRIAFYADIFYNSKQSPPYWIPPNDLDVDAVLLGGDIHYSPEQLGTMLEEIRASQNETTLIVMVPGNGEYVDQELDQSRQEYRAAVERVPNAVFLDDEAVTLPTGIRIIGSTLWSHVAEDKIDAYTTMLAGYGLQGVDNIRLDGRYLTLRDTNEFHDRARSFIEQELRPLSQAEREKTIVCTHFWPTLQPWLGPSGETGAESSSSGTSDESGDENSSEKWYQMVGTDLDAMITVYGPRFWLCGHAHESHHVAIGQTEVSSNPRAGDGPEHVNPEFVESYVLEV
jgi:Calcineurin-like phosphoesterase